MKPIAGFRKPWQNGAKAYPEADTLEALWQGVKRKRNRLTVLVRKAALVGRPCGVCGIAVDQPYEVNPGRGDYRTDGDFIYVDVNPRAKTAVPKHYYCGWGQLLQQITDLGRIIRPA